MVQWGVEWKGGEGVRLKGKRQFRGELLGRGTELTQKQGPDPALQQTAGLMVRD